MKTIIHDLEDFRLDNSFVINSNVSNCKGCFNCWVKTPRKCINKDRKNISSMLLASDEIIIISKCIYGCYSYKVKQILERCIGFVEPFFVIRNKEIHHKSRTTKNILLSVYFYGEVSEEEKKTAIKLVKSNSYNLNVSINKIVFEDISKIKEELFW